MARWSHAMKLSIYTEYEDDLQSPGVYEIGYIHAGLFHAKYIGKAPITLWSRIKTYGEAMGRKSHNRYIRELRPAAFNRLYFHVIRSDGGFDPAIREALMLIRHVYGVDGLYAWNQRYEIQPLINGGYEVT